MIELADLQIAMRLRLLGVVLATTGSVTLAATATGYTRTSGSFLTDGFRVGMEVTPAGFSDAQTRVITAVSALQLRVNTQHAAGAPTPQGAAAGRTLTAQLPALREYENDAFTPVPGRPYLSEELVPGGATILSAVADGGRTQETGLYVLRCYGVADTGHLAMRAMTQGILARYTPGTPIAVSGGTAYVRGVTAPFAGPLRRVDGGWVLSTITIPWQAFSVNAIAA
jgi:hypothetical protein